MPVKNLSDVTVKLTLSSLPNTGTAKIAILTGGNDSSAHAHVYSSINGVDNDFDENSNVYALVQHAFDVRDFNGQVEVIVAPSADVTTGASASAQPTGTGASVTTSTNTVNRFVYALKQYIDDGFTYITDDNLKESDLEAVTDYLYANQSAAFVTQFSSIAAFETFQAYSSKNQTRTDNKLNGVSALVVTNGHQPAVQLIAQASQINQDSGGVDVAKIGDLSEFVPDDNLTREDLKQISSLRGSAIVDKAGMNMMMTGFSLGANYLDNFVNTKVVKDYFQYRLQRALNDIKTRSYDQDTINFLFSIAKSAGQDLAERNFLAEEPEIEKIDMPNVSNADIENRAYNGLTVKAQISGSVESITIPINIAE